MGTWRMRRDNDVQEEGGALGKGGTSGKHDHREAVLAGAAGGGMKHVAEEFGA